MMIEFDYIVTADGVRYDLHDRRLKYLISPASNVGMPDIDIKTQRAPGQHGETVTGYTLKSKTLTMIHRRKGKTRNDHWDMRREILGLFRPNRQTAWGRYDPITFVKVLPDGSKRAYDAYFMGGLKFNQPEHFDGFSVQDTIRLLVPDPTAYDPDQIVVPLGTVVAGTELAFPIAFPIVFHASDSLNDTDTVNYVGDWDGFPIIEVDGPVTDFSITNMDTSEVIELQFSIPIGDTVTINCLAQTITNLAGTSLVGTLARNNDFGTFHLATHPESPGGVNTVFIHGLLAAAGITAVRFKFNTRYIGF